MKGPASSVYGASAMGGVINVITKHSRGKVLGGGRAAYGSFAASDLAGRAGGNLTPRIDFDVSGNVFRQGDDYNGFTTRYAWSGDGWYGYVYGILPVSGCGDDYGTAHSRITSWS